MKRLTTVGLSVLLLGFTAAVSLAGPYRVNVEKKEGVGSYLTDSKGMTLYYFRKDVQGKSVCSGECIQKWPLYLNEYVEGAEPLNAADFAVITREDGKSQSTYKGMPLYYFFKDKTAGDTTGQGVNNVWFVVAP